MNPPAWPGSDEGAQGLLRSERSSHSGLEEETFAQTARTVLRARFWLPTTRLMKTAMGTMG